MSLALLFPGQGVQHGSMLPWLDDETAAAATLDAMAARIGADWRTRLGEGDWAERNPVAQVLMTGTGIAAWQALRARGLPAAAVVAGYSVGELAAFCAANVFDAETALRLASARAAAMDRSAAGRDGGLMSVAGLAQPAIDAACRRWSLAVAIRIAPDRCLLGGTLAALDAASPALAAQGAELTRLRIRVASHTSQMNAAAAELARLIEPMAWRPADTVLVSNRNGSATRGVAALKRCLAEQIDHPVEWQRCLETIAERRPRCVLEIGAGASLARLWLAANPQTPARSVDEFASPQAVVAWVAACLAG